MELIEMFIAMLGSILASSSFWGYITLKSRVRDRERQAFNKALKQQVDTLTEKVDRLLEERDTLIETITELRTTLVETQTRKQYLEAAILNKRSW